MAKFKKKDLVGFVPSCRLCVELWAFVPSCRLCVEL
jgi:hypothetical protein